MACSDIQIALSRISSWLCFPIFDFWCGIFRRDDKLSALKRAKIERRISLDDALIKYFELI